MRDLDPREIVIIQVQPSVMINHGDPSVPVSSEIIGVTKEGKE